MSKDLEKHTAIASTLRLADDGSVPTEIVVFPAPGSATRDGRGPFIYDGEEIAADLNAAIAAGGPIALDYEHQLDDGQVRSGPIPAAGWGTAARFIPDTGIAMTVEWTPEAAELIATKAYRGFSPAFYTSKTKDKAGNTRLVRIIGGSLVNRPAFLNTWVAAEQIQPSGYTEQQTATDTNAMLLTTLIQLLGLDSAATEADVATAVSALAAASTEGGTDAEASLCAAQAKTAEVELTLASTQTELQTANAALQTAQTELQTATEQLATANTELASLRAADVERQVCSAVDAAIVAKKITPAQRDSMLLMARADLNAFTAAMAAGASVIDDAPASGAGKAATDAVVLTAAEKQFCKDYGFSEASALKTKTQRLAANS